MTYLAAIDGHYQCDRCGLTLLDLIEVRRVNSRPQWLITCGWWCGHAWLVDPVPGVLDEVESNAQVFRMRGGTRNGMSFDDMAANGDRDFIIHLSQKGTRKIHREEAKKWLDSH